MLGNTPLRYGFRTRLLHWLIALLILVLIGLGWWMVGLSYYDTWYHDATSLHEGLGVVAWVLAIVLVAGNLLNKPPKSCRLACGKSRPQGHPTSFCTFQNWVCLSPAI